PFQGGAAGYLGYDYGALLERLPAARYDDLAIPDVILGLYDWVIAWDHRLDTAWIVSTGLPETGAGQAARARERLAMVPALRPRRLPTPSSASTAPRRPGSALPSRIAAISTPWLGCASTSSQATSSRPISPSGCRRRSSSPRSSSTPGSGA